MNYYYFIRKHSKFLAFGFSLNFFSSFGQTFYLSLYNTSIREALDITQGELATLYATATILGSISMLSLGWLLDKIDLRIFVTITSLIVLLGSWVFSIADSLFLFFISIFLLRFAGQGLWGLASQVSMARYFDAERGLAASIANIGFALGFTIFPLTGIWLISIFDWREVWFSSGIFIVLIVIPLFGFFLQGHTERDKLYKQKIAADNSDRTFNTIKHWTLWQTLWDKKFWLLQPAVTAVPAIIFSIQFHQLYIIESKGWSLSVYAASYSLFALTLLLGNILGGLLIDRIGSLKVIQYSLLPLIPALISLGFSDGTLNIQVLMLFSGLAFGLALVAYITVWAELYGTKYMGAIRSCFFSLNVFFTSGVMALLGFLIDKLIGLDLMAAGGLVFILFALVLLIFTNRIVKHENASLIIKRPE